MCTSERPPLLSARLRFSIAGMKFGWIALILAAVCVGVFSAGCDQNPGPYTGPYVGNGCGGGVQCGCDAGTDGDADTTSEQTQGTPADCVEAGGLCVGSGSVCAKQGPENTCSCNPSGAFCCLLGDQ
jgi:hypothetical protein